MGPSLDGIAWAFDELDSGHDSKLIQFRPQPFFVESRKKAYEFSLSIYKMDLTAFNRLPLDEKTNYMWDHGICLAQRIVENRYILCIFELNGFYVEAIYSRRNNRVNAILPIADLPEWEGYVDQVLTNLLHLN